MIGTLADQARGIGHNLCALRNTPPIQSDAHFGAQREIGKGNVVALNPKIILRDPIGRAVKSRSVDPGATKREGDFGPKFIKRRADHPADRQTKTGRPRGIGAVQA